MWWFQLMKYWAHCAVWSQCTSVSCNRCWMGRKPPAPADTSHSGAGFTSLTPSLETMSCRRCCYLFLWLICLGSENKKTFAHELTVLSLHLWIIFLPLLSYKLQICMHNVCLQILFDVLSLLISLKQNYE